MPLILIFSVTNFSTEICPTLFDKWHGMFYMSSRSQGWIQEFLGGGGGGGGAGFLKRQVRRNFLTDQHQNNPGGGGILQRGRVLEKAGPWEFQD